MTRRVTFSRRVPWIRLGVPASPSEPDHDDVRWHARSHENHRHHSHPESGHDHVTHVYGHHHQGQGQSGGSRG